MHRVRVQQMHWAAGNWDVMQQYRRHLWVADEWIGMLREGAPSDEIGGNAHAAAMPARWLMPHPVLRSGVARQARREDGLSVK
jgi:hypothetical protein